MTTMNIKWHSLDIDNTASALNTDIRRGLSFKAADIRRQKAGGNSFFFVRTKPILSCLRDILSDPMLLLMIGIDIVALIFGEKGVAVSTSVIILLSLAAAVICYIRSQRIKESMAGYSQPKVRVIRGGMQYLADSSSLVPGDIVLLGKGDIVPCDARLISSDGLSLRLYAGKDSKKSGITVFPDALQTYDSDSTLDFFEYKNMLYAGSVVIQGEAKAIVTEIGEHTYIGALEGGIPLNGKSEQPELLYELKHFSKIYAFIALIAILPLTIVGILSYGSDRILNTFMLTMSLALSSLGELIYSFGSIITAESIYRAAKRSSKRSDESAIIKSIGKIGMLAKTDRLVLFGNAALSDGKSRVMSVYANGALLNAETLFDQSALHITELAITLNHVAESFSPMYSARRGIPDGIYAYSQRLGVDSKRIDIGTTPISFNSNEKMTAVYKDGDAQIVLNAYTFSRSVDYCFNERVYGDVILLSDEKKTSLKRIVDNFIESGNEVFVITTCINGSNEIFEGIISFKKVIAEGTAKKLFELRRAGVETVLILDDESPVSINMAIDSGIAVNSAEMAFASRYKASGKSIEDVPKNCRALLGFEKAEQKRYIDLMKQEKHVITAFSSSVDNYSSCLSANVISTCDRASYQLGKDDIVRLKQSNELAGDAVSPDGAQLLRFNSDALVHRANLGGGGVSGLYNAVKTARIIQSKLQNAVSYLLCTQAAKIAMVIPAICFGKELISPFQLLFSGLIFDFMAIISIATDKSDGEIMSGRAKSATLRKPIRNCPEMLILSTLFPFICSITALCLTSFGGAQVSGMMLVSLLLTQLLLLFRLEYNHSVKSMWSLFNVLLLVITALVLTALALVPAVAAVTGMSFSWFALISLPIAPLGIVLYSPLSKLIFKIKDRATSKTQNKNS